MKSFLEFTTLEEGAVAAHMQGKQKPYVSSDGKGNYEVLGNTGKTKAEFTRAEHGKDAHAKAQAHLKSKYNEYLNEEEELNEEVSSGNAQHALSSDSEKKEHADYMKKTHGVSTKYHGSDELSYHGSKQNVKKAVLNHYNDDESEAKDLHPHVFKESVEEELSPKQKKIASLSHPKDKIDGGDLKKLRGEETELDEEELDELSKATLGAYVKDASADRSSKNFELGYEAGAGRQPTQRAHDQEGNRRKGIRRAVARLTKEEQEVEEATIAGLSGWKKIKKDVQDKSGAVHSPMSRARNLARMALAKAKQNKQNMENK